VLRALCVLESVVAGLLALSAGILFANSRWCYSNHESCGVVEPIVAVYALGLAIPLAFAAWFHSRRWVMSGALALLPVAAIVVLLFGEAQSWW
jgi:hypothetical protein